MLTRFILLVTLLTACTTTPTVVPVEPTATLRALLTPTPWPVSATLTPIPTLSPTEAPTVSPTATPIAYIVQRGDTLIGIAVRFGVTLEALEGLNVGINPDALQLGQTILIPPGRVDAAAPLVAPTIAPLNLTVGDFNCAPTPSARTLCFSEFVNSGDQPVVNLAVQVRLGEQTATAYSPLDLIPPGVAVPLSAMFPTSTAGRAGASVTQADSGAGLADRFATLTVNDLSGVPFGGGITLSGSVTNPTTIEVQSVAVVAAVYNSSGAVVGYRKIILSDPIPSNTSASFSIILTGVADVIRWTAFAQGRTR